MRANFLGLEAFLAIAEWGSFGRAAAYLNLSQTALSHRIKKLEDDVGVKLLTRTTRQVSLTATGSELLPKAKRIMEDISTSFEDLRERGKQRQSRLSIGCLPTIATHILPTILESFVRFYPDVPIRIFDNSVAEIAQKAQEGEIEFGVTTVSAGQWDLDVQPIGKEPFVLICRAGDVFAERSVVEWSDLTGRKLVRVSQQLTNRVLIDEALGSRRETMTWHFEAQHLATAVGFVSAGLGVSVVPKLTGEAVVQRGIVAVSLRGPTISRTLGIVSKRGVPFSPAGETLALMIREHLVAAL